MDNIIMQKNQLRFKKIISDLEQLSNITIFDIDQTHKPDMPLFNTEVRWTKLYFNIENPLSSYVQSGNVNDFQKFSFCEIMKFNEQQRTQLLSCGIYQNILKQFNQQSK